VSFDELLEMCATGCPKPAMRSVEYARRWGVTLHVRSAFTWEPGTWVHEEDTTMEQAIVSAVTHDVSEAKVTVSGVPDRPGIAARLFRELADVDVNVDMIVQNVSDHGVTDISFTVPRRDLVTGTEVCRRLADEIGATGVSSDADIARVSIVGAGMKSNPGVAARMFQVLADRGINVRMIATSPIKVSCVIDRARVGEAVAALHDAFQAELEVSADGAVGV
jgi:aspartate kinase